MKEKVESALNKIRPSLKADGGDVELVEVTSDGVVKVRLTGACGSCPMSQMTMKMGIEKIIKGEVPEIKEVVAVQCFNIYLTVGSTPNALWKEYVLEEGKG